MQVYLVIVEDRHTDVEVLAYLDRDTALNYAMEYLASFHQRYGSSPLIKRVGNDYIHIIEPMPTFEEYYGTEGQADDREYNELPFIRRAFLEGDDRLLFAKYSVEDDFITVRPVMIVE